MLQSSLGTPEDDHVNPFETIYCSFEYPRYKPYFRLIKSENTAYTLCEVQFTYIWVLYSKQIILFRISRMEYYPCFSIRVICTLANSSFNCKFEIIYISWQHNFEAVLSNILFDEAGLVVEYVLSDYPPALPYAAFFFPL